MTDVRAARVEVGGDAAEAVGSPAAPTQHANNNFDLIRVAAAFQVLVVHAVEHLHAEPLRTFGEWSSYFPGVPILFVVSGFLISRSWERAPAAGQYFMNRMLRIYPALWVCLIISIGIFLSAGVRPSVGEFLPWLIAQITIGQSYNPDWLRGFGTGVLNGSLWTIIVELQFYFALPVLAWLAVRVKGAWWTIAALAFILMLAARAFVGQRVTMEQKLLDVTLAPYLFFFVTGVVGQHLVRRHPRLFEGRFLFWLAAYMAWVFIERAAAIKGSGGNALNPVSIILVAGLTISAAFSMRGLSRILRGNDISYGTYIYHMPVINLALFHGVTGMRGFFVLLVAAPLLALLSWLFVERPALALKRYSARW